MNGFWAEFESLLRLSIDYTWIVLTVKAIWRGGAKFEKLLSVHRRELYFLVAFPILAKIYTLSASDSNIQSKYFRIFISLEQFHFIYRKIRAGRNKMHDSSENNKK